MVKVHPKVGRVSRKLMGGAVEAVEKTEVLRRQQADFGGGNVMAGNSNASFLAVLADHSPWHDPETLDGRSAGDGGDSAEISRFVVNKVVTKRGNGESASRIKNNLEDVGVKASSW
jgi:hypothetical protein